ncbi:MAG: YcgL domain-containing protein [Thiofilum sp.]|uniref:YcgL domain-containing protein n=1 Tax=Thiofilum sp. TaxID=2212733 RepID=UPI0025E18BE4|nr:YcgL domain-containing protein [Thiofilum sp.]MBK8452648.1 YcgL domain-containing protein [Thiofilum sp.]
MQCYIYRSERKKGAYLFLVERDDFNRVPEGLMRLFGTAHFSFEFELHPDKPLAQGSSAEVIRHLSEHGFYLQLPPNELTDARVH